LVGQSDSSGSIDVDGQIKISYSDPVLTLTAMDLDLPYTIDAIQELPGHQDRAWHVAWNPAKPLLSFCSADKTVRMYSYANPTEVSSGPTFSHIATISTGHTKTVRSVAWAPSGNTLATASFDSNIGIWEQEESEDDDGRKGEWECASLLEGHETECKSVAYSSSGTLLASCSRDKTVWIWEGECSHGSSSRPVT
jgi:WD40 repeat protein